MHSVTNCHFQHDTSSATHSSSSIMESQPSDMTVSKTTKTTQTTQTPKHHRKGTQSANLIPAKFHKKGTKQRHSKREMRSHFNNHYIYYGPFTAIMDCLFWREQIPSFGPQRHWGWNLILWSGPFFVHYGHRRVHLLRFTSFGR